MQRRQDINQELAIVYSRVSLECKSYLESDPHVEREDTCKGLLALLEQLKVILNEVNGLPVEERAKNYHVTYNAINYILQISQHLRRTSFAFQTTIYLMEALKAMQGNLILQDVKYLDKRTDLFLKVCKIYEDGQYSQQAVALLDSAGKMYKELKSIHELDPPVPNYIQTILSNNIKLIKVFFIKYSIQAGMLSPAEWKKKVDEEFGDDIEAKLMCLVQSLRTQTKKHSNIFTKNLKTYKDSLLVNGYEMIKPHLQVLTKGLSQQKEKIERQVNFKSTMNATQQQINQQIKKRRELEEKYLKQSELKKASESFPLQYHAQLIHYALQTKNNKILAELIEAAQIRVECRRIQVPYVNDITIIVSNSPYPNVPNGYTKIPIDLNEANLKKQLAKLRKSGKKAPDDETLKTPVVNAASTGKDDKKDNKKGGKEPTQSQPLAQNKQNDANREPSQWQLNQIKHKYVFMMIKKSMSPEEALYDLTIVMGNEEKGPVGFADNRRIIVPYIQQNMKIMESEVSQHTGVRQTTGMVPYIVLYHSRNGLDSDQQKKSIITDVIPLIGKNPMIPAKWGYKKIDSDLRQVPSEFIKAPNHDYVYLTYKTDELFHISERHIQIVKTFVDLQATYGQRKGTSNEEQKLLQMQINFDLQKLNLFFQSLQQALRGDLGQQYYLQRCDFLTHLTFEIWSKYLKNPLIQFDYMRQQRLNGQIIDYDYENYKKISQNCSPIFLRGLKVLNLIMINNPKADVLLQSKINLQLAKMLQESKMYKVAAQNLKLSLDRLRVYRDEYLAKGVDGSSDKILPFSITCSNAQIKTTIETMKIKFFEQRRYLQKVNRIRERQKNGQKQLTQEQLDEQQKQFIRLRKSDSFDQIVEKINNKHSQLYSIIYALELDLLNVYFRVSLKRSQEITQLQNSKNDMTSGIRNTELEGLATTLKQKLGLATGPTQTKNIQNLNQLQNTLVQANKLPTPKPKMQKMQARLIIQNQKNPYAIALLMLNLAALNSANKDKRYYLQQSLNYIEKCNQAQKNMISKSISNAIFIFSGLWDNKVHQDQSSDKIYPFKDLYNSIWQNETEVPEPPILINKNSTSIHLKLPPFMPAKQNQKKQPKIVKYMSIYGKPSANGVDVSLNCVDLQGTGIRKQIGKTMTISSLSPNNMYCFAAAGIDQNEQVMSIGKTGQDIGTYNPLSVPMLASYLAKVSYQINEYEIAEKAAKIVLKQYCQQSNYMTCDERVNNLYYYTINEQSISGISLIQIKSVAEAFYVLALCERKKLNQMKESSQDRPQIILQQKQKLITNLLLLSASLTPSLSSPNMSIPFLIPQKQTLLRAYVISMVPEKWMNPKLRRIGVGVMEKLLKWGLENNQVSLARRLVYKWNQRKFLLMGKMIQIEQKKQVKKGAKDSKQQQVKMVDKYCRLMIQKSPQLMDAFEDSMIMISQDYYDYVSMFVERAKEQISTMSQFVDNPSEEIDSINNHLSLKLELLDYLKEPLVSIKKITNTSPYYIEYNCKILKKALQMASQAQFKQVFAKSEELDVPDVTDEIKLAKDIYELMFAAIKDDIAWNPCSKKQLIQFQQKTGKDLKKSIDIFNTWEQKKTELTNKIRKSLTFANKYKDFDYLQMWISELYHLKAQSLVITNCNDFHVKRKIKIRYDKIRSMNLEDLFKKEIEVAVLEDKPYAYSEDQLKKLTQILNYICQAVYAALVVQNWLKLQTILKFLCNLICYIEITPFYHKGSQIWTQFAFISLCTIQMLNKIKANGFGQFKKRYRTKLMNTELASVTSKLQLGDFAAQQLIDEFLPQYYLPDLDSNTTKSFWFMRQQNIDIQALSSIIAYTVNTLRLENKHNLVINIVMDFCNVTQHYFSLVLLPFMTNSQSKLLEQVQQMIQKESAELLAVQNIYNQEKDKKAKKRAAMLSGQKMEFEIVYEEKSAKLKQSLRLLNEQKRFIQSQTNKSNKIKDQISRDTSKQVLAQKDQKKYTQQFGEHYEEMYRQFGEDAKHVKKSKNFIKDIINKYDAIYEQLKNSKTSKDTLAQVQNRNDVGNLWYASGNIEKAFEFWNDSLATIFKTVNPIENYHTIIEENKPYLVKNVGNKQVIMGICLLYKISKFGCGHKLQIQRASTHFACHLAFSLFQGNLDYPQTCEMFKNFRIKTFPARQIFSDQQSVNLTELLSSLQYFIYKNIYDQNCLQALPLTSFYQYITTDVVKNTQLSIRAKILKAITLSESGLISESISYLVKVCNDKDLPILWLQSSDYLKKQKGMNWTQQGLIYNNSQFWTNNDNKAVIEELKKLALKPEASTQNGIISPILFNYAKSLILSKIYQNQICKDQALNEQRLLALNEAEAIMRDCLKKLAVVEQSYCLLEELEASQLLYKQNEVSDDLKKQMQLNRAKLIDFLKKNGGDDNLVKIYQKEESSSIKRTFRLQIMCRIRFSLHKISESKNLYTNSYFILKNGLNNIHRYAFGARLCETGVDPEIKAPSLAPPINAGKKDDKKGGKKEEEVSQALVAPPVDALKQKELKNKNEAKTSRTALNSYWHLKILVEIGKILFKQNNFKQAVKLFQSIIQFSKKYEEEYFNTLSKGYICRCTLRLGNFQPQFFEQIISQMQKKHYFDVNYINLVMDYGELLSGHVRSLQYLKKGKQIALKLWERYGMKSVLSGIGLPVPSKHYYIKQQITPEQEENIKKKKKGQKKVGKDDKKAPPKKEDPKKKKEDTKIQYKVTPLSKITEVNLLQQQKNIFGQFNINPHPNYRKNNIYQTMPIIFIKSFLRQFQEQIRCLVEKEYLQEIPYVIKLLHVLQSYYHSTEQLKIILYNCLGQINKNTFVLRLKLLIKQTKPNYLGLVKTPFQDLPLNNSLINIPAYSQFLAENKKLLLDAKSWFKKCLSLAQNSTLFYERSINLQDIAWQYADNQCFLTEYVGRQKPKFFPQDQATINHDQFKLQSMNHLFQANGFLDIAIKIRSIKFQITRNYLQIGGKGIDATAKIDEDISSQILQMDKQSKNIYPKFLLQAFKGKGPLTGTDILTFMLKIYRQAEYMTFTNSNYQNLLFKCNRILIKSLAGYKEKCVLNSIEIPLKKSIKQKFVDFDAIVVKSIKTDNSQVFLYILGPISEGEQNYYGRVTIELQTLSKITEDLLSLTTKTSLSDKKSESVKNRDYIFHKKQFKRILSDLSIRFGNNPDQQKGIPSEYQVQLTGENLRSMNKLLDSNGLNLKSKEINKYMRYLHKIKYQLL